MAIYLSRKKGGTVATPITPSNSSPAQMTANVAVNPTANGYAIQSYDSVTPSSTPTSVSTDDIVKFDGSGKIVDDLTSITPTGTPTSVSSGDNIHIGGSGEIVSSIINVEVTSANHKSPTARGGNYHIDTNSAVHGFIVGGWSFATPSDSNPPAVAQDSLIYPNAAGYLYATQQPTPTSITPSNSSPVALTANTPVNPTASGYAIQSYSSKTPSDSSPASVSSGAIIKNAGSSTGYLYASSGLKNVPTYFSGISATYSNTSGTNSVSVTNGKKYLFITLRYSTSSTPADGGVSSGATVDKVYMDNVATSTPRVKLYVAMVTATSSTITAIGSGNICSVIPLN